MVRTRQQTGEMVTASLVTALMGAAAYITLPVGAVPVTLQVFVVVLASLLLTAPWAGASMVLYLALGAAGLPVFSGAQGGVGVLAGPTGGYLVGFAVAAPTAAMLRTLVARRRPGGIADAIAATVAILIIYAIGTVQLALVTGMGMGAAVLVGAVPFVLPDALKAAASIAVAGAVRRARGPITRAERAATR